MEKGNKVFLWRRIKTEKEKEENIWRRQIYFLRRRRKSEKEKEENILKRQIYLTHFTTLCTDLVHVDPKLGLLRD